MSISPEEAAHRAASDVEQVIWVDEQDNPLGSLPRAELRERGLIGRGTFILLFNSKGELCIHQRTLSKAVYPGYWDVAAGGMVAEGESYAESAERELAEELGIRDASLTEHVRFFFDEPGNRLWGALFSAVSDSPVQVQPEEVLQACFLPLDEVLRLFDERPFCPDSRLALERYLVSELKPLL